MKKPICSIDIIVQDSDGKILLGKVAEKWQDNDKYLWGLPGREIEFGETFEQRTKRNLHDELELKYCFYRQLEEDNL